MAPIARQRIRQCLIAVAVLPVTSVGGGLASPDHSSILRARVVGMDEYKGTGADAARGALTNLAGAVNDCRDIAGTLDRLGVDDLTVLENGAAMRDRLVREWTELLERSLPGDTIFLRLRASYVCGPRRPAAGTLPGQREGRHG